MAAGTAIPELDPRATRERARAGEIALVDVREPAEWSEGHLPEAVLVPRGSLPEQIREVAPDLSRPVVLYCGSGKRSLLAAETMRELGYEAVASMSGGITEWKELDLPGRRPRLARGRAAAPLQPPHPDPGGRARGPAAPARVARPPDRRGRPRLARGALPGRRGGRNARDRRRRHGRRVEPPAPDRPLDRAARRAEGRVRAAHARSAEPGRHRPDLRGAPDLRERRPDPRRGLGRDRGRRRQLPDALPPERRLGLARDPRRARLDLPLRGPDDRLQARRRPLLPVSLPGAASARARPELRRGRRARSPARASSARSRRARR